VMVGEYDKAVDELEFLLSIPSELSITLLRLDPAWAPLRDHPRFKGLLVRGRGIVQYDWQSHIGAFVRVLNE